MKNYYFDYNSTTPINQKVQKVIFHTMEKHFGNPSNLHSRGREAKKILENSRQKVADLIGADKEEIYFTSGGTEANNIALKGFFPLYKRGKNHIITSAIEHSSVFETVKYLRDSGVEITVLNVDSEGKIDMEQLTKSIKKNTAVISIMTANNETGIIQNMDRISSIAGEHGVILHSDAIQAVGKLPVKVNNPGIDLLSLSSHKIYGPKGVGALYVRRGLSISPLFHGGGQEYKLRSGTENVPYIAGFGEACRICEENYDKETKHMMQLKNILYRGLKEKIKYIKLNGSLNDSLPNTLNISFPGCESETLVLDLDSAGFQVSAGSACSSIGSANSRVLKAMKLKPLELFSSIRFSLGRETKEKEVLLLIDTLSKIVQDFV